MAYPEKNASYTHNPKFLDRMKQAEGGACSTPYRADGGQASTFKPSPGSPFLPMKAVSGDIPESYEPEHKGD